MRISQDQGRICATYSVSRLCPPRCIEVVMVNVKTEGVRPAIEVVSQTPINHLAEEKNDLKSRLYTKPVNSESLCS